jgi:hypothetical protein
MLMRNLHLRWEVAMHDKIEGLGQLTRQLEEASRVFKSLGGELEQVTLEPGNQACGDGDPAGGSDHRSEGRALSRK